MGARRQPSEDSRGFTITELVVVVAAIGILAAITIPLMANFIQAMQIRGAAQEVKSLLNQARQLAITQNTSYRVDVDAANTRLRFCPGAALCTNASAWKGPGTDGNGFLRLASQVNIVAAASAGNLVFTPLGAASTAGTLRVQSTQGNTCMDVVTSASGRINTAASAACP